MFEKCLQSESSGQNNFNLCVFNAIIKANVCFLKTMKINHLLVYLMSRFIF